MEILLKILAIMLCAISAIVSLYYLMNSKEIYKTYAEAHRKKPKTLWQRLNAPSENIRKLHVLLAPIIIALSVFSIVYLLQNW